jgi:hypothetical protein
MVLARPPVNPGLRTPTKLLWPSIAVVPATVEAPGMVVVPILLMTLPAPPDIELPDTLPVGLMIVPMLKPMPLVWVFIVVMVPMPVGVEPPLLVLLIKEEVPEIKPS